MQNDPMRRLLIASGRFLLPALALIGSACPACRSREAAPPAHSAAAPARPVQAAPAVSASARAAADAAAVTSPAAAPSATLDASAPAAPDASAAPPPAAPAPAGQAPPGEDLAVLATADALVRVSTRDKSVTELAHEHVTWCAVDNRAQAIWYLTEQELPPPQSADSRHAEMVALKVIDLSGAPEPAAPLTVVPPTRVRSASPELRPVISYGDSATVGDELFVFSSGILLQLNLVPRPKLRIELTCDGDAAWYCYQMDKEQEPVPGTTETWWPVNPDIAATLKDLKRMRLQQLDKLTALARRGAGRRQWLGPKDQGSGSKGNDRALPKVKSVPQKPCEEGGCGDAKAIPGTPYWAVVVASSRGDFFHETQQFYDPARKRFFDPRRPGLSSPRPLNRDKAEGEKLGDDGPELHSMLIARSGQSLLMDGALISLDRGVVFKGQRECGFIGGGWTYMHPYP